MASHVTLKNMLAAFAAFGLALAVGFWFMRPGNMEAEQKEVRRLFLRGDYQQAQQLADTVLSWRPELDEVRLMAAQSSSRIGDPVQAMNYLIPLLTNNGPEKLKATLLEAHVAVSQLFDLRQSEAAYRTALQLDADNVEALEGFVRLLATCGRRREAIPSLLNLCQLRHGSDLLTISARGSGAVNDIDLLNNAIAVDPNCSSALVGLAMHSSRADEVDVAIRLCRQAIAANPEFAAAHVDLGQYLLSSGQFDQLISWEAQLPANCLQNPEAWRVLGYAAEHQGRRQLALTRFLKASQLGPDLKDVYFRLSQLLQQADDEAAAEQFSQRLRQLQDLEAQQDRIFNSGLGDVVAVTKMVQAFQKVGRLWEAFGWAQLALSNQPNNETLKSLFVELSELTEDLPLQLEAPTFNVAAGFSAESYSLTDIDSAMQSLPLSTTTRPVSLISFRDDALAVGLNFTFHPGVVGPTTHRMFEFTGGGIGVIDFDLDGFPDMYFSQGGPWETRGHGNNASDALYRNIRGVRFADFADTAGIEDADFGQGVAIGDINSDGFPDIFVSNIGDNNLWVNNGDGTFLRQQLPQPASADEWTTSALIADLNNDGDADIYAANYLTDDDIFDRICSSAPGVPQACVPTQFNGVRDLLYVNDHAGSFIDESPRLTSFGTGKGLGVVAFSPAGDGQLAVMIANDTTPNMLVAIQDDGSVQDRGFASGLAVNGTGKAEGCMGIAVGDVSNDGVFELLVTNFYNESNTFYHGIDGNLFDDRTALADLADVSMPQLGFGCQFLDADLDGTLELVVANGHVDDLRHLGKPYKMPAQFFRQQQGAFAEMDSKKLGPYFQQTHIGRSVVCLDWNIDGHPDVAFGHLLEPYSVLTNTTADAGNTVCLKFVGIGSSRDAVGVTVSYQLNDQTLTRQITAGDGYQASNQRELWLGCGTMQQIESLSIVWPSGHRETVNNLSAGSRLTVVEQRGMTYLMPR